MADEPTATPSPARQPAAGQSPDPGRERWRATTRATAVAANPERRARFVSSSEIEIADLYTPADVAALDEERDLGRPGEYPFTRGVQPTMYRGRLWTMRQYAGFATAEETNRALPLPPRAGPDGAIGRLRPADADGLRRRRAGGGGRGGPGGRARLLARRHGDALRRDSRSER